MTAASAETVATSASSSRVRYAWLFSRRADIGMLLIPAIVTATAFVVALRLGQDTYGSARGFAGWATAYLLGNTSHVILTYLLLAARPDVLHATPRQARSVLGGSVLVFVLAVVLRQLTRGNPWTSPFYEAVIVIFATHHTLSQAKGFWALYGLRAAQAGLPAPNHPERELQKVFVPLALLLIAVKWTLVARTSDPSASPYLNVNPGDPSILPFAVSFGLIAAWLWFVGALFRALLAHEAVNAPKLLYLGTQCGVVLLELVSPSWGVTLSAGIHGLEYFLLTRRMLAPTGAEPSSKLTASLCVPAMIAAMSPILAVGILNNPFVQVTGVSESLRGWALVLVNATVLAHYCADAFIYRFRIPNVRKVALARLGF